MINLELYKKLYLIRKAEEVIIENYCDNNMKTPMHMSMGSEAISTGVCSNLNEEDQVFGTFRSHAPYLAKTMDIDGFFAELYGKKNGCCEGKAGSMHLCNMEKGYVSSSAIVASNIPVSVGAAFANKIKKNDKKVVVFFGDGATEEGSFWESINIASLWSLPVLFVCEDNRLAVHTYKENRQGYRDIVSIVDNFDIITKYGSGVDVEDVYNMAYSVIRDMETYGKPGFIKLEYYRFLEHVGISSDYYENYRKNDIWKKSDDNDPILVARKKLKSANILDIEKEIDEKVYRALGKAKISKLSAVNELYKDVYYC